MFPYCYQCKYKVKFLLNKNGKRDLPFVKLKVQGEIYRSHSGKLTRRGKYAKFMLDTGAEVTVISMVSAASLDIVIGKTSKIYVINPIIRGGVPALGKRCFINVRFPGSKSIFPLPVIVLLNDHSDTKVLGREGVITEMELVLHRDGVCIKPS